MSAPLRLCIIGNSHLAAIKLGWSSIASEHPGIQPTFFGSPRATLRELHWRGPVLAARTEPVRRSLRLTSGGQHEIDPRQFDAVLLCGLGFGLRQAAKLYQSHRHLRLARPPAGIHLVSAACFQEALLGLMEQTVAVRLGRLIRQGCALPLLLLPTPMPSEDLLQSEMEDVIGWWKPVLQAGDEAALLAEHERACAALVPPFSRILPQAAETLASPMTTRRSFQQGGVHLTAGPSERPAEADATHMNAAYGAATLREALAALALMRETAQTERA